MIELALLARAQGWKFSSSTSNSTSGTALPIEPMRRKSFEDGR